MTAKPLPRAARSLFPLLMLLATAATGEEISPRIVADPAASYLGGSPLAWAERRAATVSIADGRSHDIAATFGARFRQGDPVPTEDARRIAVVANGRNDSGDRRASVHAIYAEAVRQRRDPALTAGDAIALEVQAVSLAPANAINAINPYDNLRGRTYGLILGSGGDTYAGAGQADSALTVDHNGSTWNQGLVFRHDALTEQNSPLTRRQASYALEMGENQQITWWHNDTPDHRGAEMAAIVGRGGGALETHARTDMQMTAGDAITLDAAQYRATLDADGFAVLSEVSGTLQQPFRISGNTVILDIAHLPTSRAEVAPGGIYVETDPDGASGTLRIRMSPD